MVDLTPSDCFEQIVGLTIIHFNFYTIANKPSGLVGIFVNPYLLGQTMEKD